MAEQWTERANDEDSVLRRQEARSVRPSCEMLIRRGTERRTSVTTTVPPARSLR